MKKYMIGVTSLLFTIVLFLLPVNIFKSNIKINYELETEKIGVYVYYAVNNEVVGVPIYDISSNKYTQIKEVYMYLTEKSNYVDEKDVLFPIEVSRKDGCSFVLTKYGQYADADFAKCVIFPKGKTTWEGFHRPFRDGDVVAYDGADGETQLYICKDQSEINHCCLCYLRLDCDGELDLDKGWYYITRFATEEEKIKLFKANKDKGYHWNPETKTLKKLVEPKLKVGDRIKSIYNTFQYDIKELTDTHYTLVEVEDKFKYTEPIIEDKNWELVPNKFDITTLKPFESRVLVKNEKHHIWFPSFFGLYNKDSNAPFMCCNGFEYKYCIPYEANKELLGTTNDCDDFYKTWEK
jgi:hypothetical protein